MSDNDYEGFGNLFDPEGKGWSEAFPDEEFDEQIAECTVRDVKFDRNPRPIRQLNVRVVKLDAVGIIDGNTDDPRPISRYSGAALERLSKEGLKPAARGSKAHHMTTNWAAAGLPMRELDIPQPLDEEGNFVPLPEDSWVSPKDNETKTANQVHLETLEGLKCRFRLRRRMKLGKQEAHDVLEIIKVFPLDYEPDDVEQVAWKSEGAGEAPPGEVPSNVAAEQPAAVDPEEAEKAAIQALVGKTADSSGAVEALMELDEQFRVEPFISGLSGAEIALVKEYIEGGKLVEVDGKLALPA